MKSIRPKEHAEVRPRRSAAPSASAVEPGPPGQAAGDSNGGSPNGFKHIDDPPTRSDLRPGEPSDERLLDEYRHGDKAAFAKLVARYHRELYHFLVRFLANRATAEDVFQETFLQVHQSAQTFDPTRRFRPWLFTIAANKARDLLRSQSRRPINPLQATIDRNDSEGREFIDLLPSLAELPGDALERHELEQRVHDTVVGLPEPLREIILLSYFHQFPYKQISEILNIPLGTVKSRLHAAVAHFADRWRAANTHKSSA
ncbi:MAG TPA: sigma-70 family RNA polymerase sigma factor [Tepidisphaeraceae bacterium]|jgi:RNA polymerase sigma-70 factor (ECF subfamily)|nr:sigma-70 family RNA polymerase sigma factor [Tepidisphaeraceae bacterium]